MDLLLFFLEVCGRARSGELLFPAVIVAGSLRSSRFSAVP